MLHRKIRYFLDLVWVLTHKDLKVRYKSNILGYLWSVAHPLALATVFFIAFKVIMKIPMPAYSLFLIAGLFPWQWFSNSLAIAPSVFLANANIIKKVNFPRNVLPLAVVLQDMIHFILSVPVIAGFVLFYRQPIHLSWLYGIPMLLILQMMLVYGVALLVSSVNLFFRDLERMVTIGLTFFFYFTPIFYPLEMVPAAYRSWLNLNPACPLILSWQQLFLAGRLDPGYILLSLAYGIAALAAGTWTYHRLSRKFAEVI